MAFLRWSWMLASSTFTGFASDIAGHAIVAWLLFRHIALDPSCITGETSLSGSLALGLSVCVGHIRLRRVVYHRRLGESIEQATQGDARFADGGKRQSSIPPPLREVVGAASH